jgi:hypothetical protein
MFFVVFRNDSHWMSPKIAGGLAKTDRYAVLAPVDDGLVRARAALVNLCKLDLYRAICPVSEGRLGTWMLSAELRMQ